MLLVRISGGTLSAPVTGGNDGAYGGNDRRAQEDVGGCCRKRGTGGEVQFQRRKFRTPDGDLQVLSGWFTELGLKEVVMESTAQYWKPVWQVLEETGHFHLELAQAQI